MGKDELEIERPDEFLGRERRLQRAGMVALSFFALAGAAGAFGNGPASHALKSAGAAVISYERFGRVSAPMLIGITVHTTAGEGQPVRMLITRTILEQVSALDIRPPDALRGFDEAFAVFEVPAAAGRAHLELRYTPERFGLLRTTVRPESGAAAELWQLIYF